MLMPHGRPPKRVLVIQLRRLGDVVLTAGLLEDLHDAVPGATLGFLVGAGAAPLLDGHPLLHERIIYDPRRPARMAHLVRARRFDWVVDVQSSPRTALLTRLSGAPVRAGWDIGVWAWAYTHTLPRHGRPAEYVVRERQRLLELLGVSVGPPRTRLTVTPGERARAEAELRAHGVPERGPRVGLVLSAGNRVREWPVERFAELASALADDGAFPVALENPGDGERVARLRALEPRVVGVPTLELRLLVGAIAACRVLVSPDTGPAHIASALGVPRVTVYGPTDPAAWCPDVPTAHAVRASGRLTLSARERGAADGVTLGITDVAAGEVLARVRELMARPLAPAIPAVPGG